MSILITGATSGVGFATAASLARAGRPVALVGRTEASAEAVRERLPADATVHAYGADLARHAQVRELADAVRRDTGRLDAMVLAAGVANPEQTQTAGVDTTLAVNHLAPVRLVELLEPILDGGRIIVVGSSQHGAAGTFDPGVFEAGSPDRRYKTTKLLNLLYVAGRRSRPHTAPLEVVDPGFVRTNLGRHAHGLFRLLLTLTRPIQAAPDKPAALISERLHAADFTDGAYRHAKGLARHAPNARDQEAIARAWDWTTERIETW